MSNTAVGDEPSLPLRRRDDEDDIDRSELDDLSELTAEQRQLYFKDSFTKQVEPLAFISRPDECDLFPEYAEEIITAYLRYTTFTIKVWTNYDAAAKKFYIDSRANDCGKIILNSSQQARLDQIDRQGAIQLNRIRFEVGTPFTDLCTVKALAVPSKLEVGMDVRAKMAEINTDHPRAINFATNICNKLDQADLTPGQDGFWMADLEAIAELFCRKPTDQQMENLHRKPDAGPWMDFHGASKNDGWVDLEATDQGCYSGCQGCSGSKYGWSSGGSMFTSSWYS